VSEVYQTIVCHNTNNQGHTMQTEFLALLGFMQTQSDLGHCIFKRLLHLLLDVAATHGCDEYQQV
jgi:hypothetical protein